MGRILIRGAQVIASPPRRPSVGPMDILIEGGAIVAIGPALAADDAEVVEAAGRLVMPGLVNAHLHTWQTALRGMACDWNMMEYLQWVHAQMTPHFTPQDIHDGTLAGALNQIACGATTLGDWCHNNPTPEHTDAAVAALKASGIRAVFFHGTPRPHVSASAFASSQVPHPRAELERLLKGPFGSRDGLLTLGMAVGGPQYSPFEIAEHDLRLARDLDLVVSMHHSGGVAPVPDAWERLDALGLLGPKVNVVHGNHLSDEDLKRLVGAGVSLTVTPEVEMSDGHGHPITGRLRALGAAPSIGIDIETAISGEMLTAARIALVHQRALDYAAARGGASTGAIRASEALAWATIEGGRALGLGRIGSLEPGKQADLILIDASALNLSPNNDLAVTALHASLANIEAVMVAGRWRKKDGRLLQGGIAELRAALSASSARIAAAAGLVTVEPAAA